MSSLSVIEESDSNPRQRFGGIIRLWVTIFPIFILSDPSFVHMILSSKVQTKKAGFYKIFTKVLGPKSLVLIDDPEMTLKRKSQQRLFTSSAYENYLEIFGILAKIFVKDMEEHIDEDLNIVKKSNQCVKNISNCVMLGIPPEELGNQQVEKLMT